MRYGIVIAVAVIIALALIIGYNMMDNEHKQQLNESQVCFGDDCFQVELALTPAEQSQGLMHRDQLDPDMGMLFVFQQEGIYPFWMKNTLIPLDIIWINENLTVVHIEENAQPCSPLSCTMMTPDHEARYVLEINGGLAEQIGLRIGDNTAINYL